MLCTKIQNLKFSLLLNLNHHYLFNILKAIKNLSCSIFFSFLTTNSQQCSKTFHPLWASMSTSVKVPHGTFFLIGNLLNPLNHSRWRHNDLKRKKRRRKRREGETGWDLWSSAAVLQCLHLDTPLLEQ